VKTTVQETRLDGADVHGGIRLRPQLRPGQGDELPEQRIAALDYDSRGNCSARPPSERMGREARPTACAGCHARAGDRAAWATANHRGGPVGRLQPDPIHMHEEATARYEGSSPADVEAGVRNTGKIRPRSGSVLQRKTGKGRKAYTADIKYSEQSLRQMDGRWSFTQSVNEVTFSPRRSRWPSEQTVDGRFFFSWFLSAASLRSQDMNKRLLLVLPRGVCSQSAANLHLESNNTYIIGGRLGFPAD